MSDLQVLMRLTTESQTKPIKRGTGGDRSESPTGGCPGGKATVCHATAPGSPSPGRKWRKNRERKEAGRAVAVSTHLPQLTAVLS